jgi:hypothetical protein
MTLEMLGMQNNSYCTHAGGLSTTGSTDPESDFVQARTRALGLFLDGEHALMGY